MRRVIGMSVSLSIAVLALAGCPTPQGLCRSGVDQLCERQHECRSAAEKSTTQFIQQFGTSVDDCKTRLYANPPPPPGQTTSIPCDQVEDDRDLCSNLGEPGATEFDVGKADECRDARAKMSCQDYLAQVSNSSLAPASCADRCR